jgi:hypothetical protein
VEDERKGIGPGNFDEVTEGNIALGIGKPLLNVAAAMRKKKSLLTGIEKAGGTKLLDSQKGMDDLIGSTQ